MSLIRKFAAGLGTLFRKDKAHQDLDEELHSFVEASAEHKMRGGMNRNEALRAARVELGSATAVKDKVYQSYWESMVEIAWRECQPKRHTCCVG